MEVTDCTNNNFMYLIQDRQILHPVAANS